jgi:uncharacterized glyoxalase superfamily protein PhnB
MNKVALSDTIIELSVPDFSVAKEFYIKLGFKVIWEEPPKGMNGYMVMKYKNSILCFFCGNDEVYKHPYFQKFPRNTIRGYGVEISIPIKNIDVYYQNIKGKIPEKNIFQSLKLQPWGKKDFRVVDPFGYFLRFNEPWNVLEYLPLDSDYKSD